MRVPDRSTSRERGVALLLTLFIVLIVAAVVIQLAVSTTSEYAVSVNEVTSARLDGAASCAFAEARKALIEDAQASAGGGAGAGGAGGLPIPGGMGGGGSPGDPSGGKQDDADSFNDSWSHDQQTNYGEINVRVHVEDENRKFNLLSLVSKDPDFARASGERLARIIDMLREGGRSEFDIDTATAQTLVQRIRDWIDGSNRKGFSRPTLLSTKPDSSLTLPITIDELLLVEGIDENLLYDRKVDGIDYPGLASVLTVWTSLEAGPLKTDDPTAAGASGTGTPGASGTPAPANVGKTTATANGALGAGGGAGASGGPAQADAAVGAGKSNGIKININTVPPCVLRALMPNYEIPTDVIDAIIRHRNMLDEEKLDSQRESGDFNAGLPAGVDPASKLVDRSGVQSGEAVPPTHYFASLQDLDKVDEWKGFSNDTAKKEFLKLLTTKSDVFSIHVTARPSSGPGSLQGANSDAFGNITNAGGEPDPEDEPGGIVKRYRQVVWRRVGGSDAVLTPVLVLEERFDRKLSLLDFPVDPRTGQRITR